jgi:hypothetical protein
LVSKAILGGFLMKNTRLFQNQPSFGIAATERMAKNIRMGVYKICRRTLNVKFS